MAGISTDKKSLPAWLPWLLLAVGIVAAFLWLMAATADPNPEGARYDGTANPGYSEGSTGDAGTISAGTMAISGSAGLRSLAGMIGREVELVDVPVNEVVGDIGFTVGRTRNETLVIVDSGYTQGTAIEGGSNVTVIGIVQAYPGDLPQSVTDQVDADNSAMIIASLVSAVE